MGGLVGAGVDAAAAEQRLRLIGRILSAVDFVIVGKRLTGGAARGKVIAHAEENIGRQGGGREVALQLTEKDVDQRFQFDFVIGFRRTVVECGLEAENQRHAEDGANLGLVPNRTIEEKFPQFRELVLFQIEIDEGVEREFKSGRISGLCQFHDDAPQSAQALTSPSDLVEGWPLGHGHLGAIGGVIRMVLPEAVGVRNRLFGARVAFGAEEGHEVVERLASDGRVAAALGECECGEI